jgi:hypothetical protein
MFTSSQSQVKQIGYANLELGQGLWQVLLQVQGMDG